ncbi:MAG: hypothetical protein L0I64_11790 [Lactococcus lactis]|nr:hypothetical protein [Lactococcus lactis]MDN6096118.1 hypothetical protein [Lactococcus lactis]MDN6196213.1 hypothetical protein [Atopostipes suicloacalis]
MSQRNNITITVNGVVEYNEELDPFCKISVNIQAGKVSLIRKEIDEKPLSWYNYSNNKESLSE